MNTIHIVKSGKKENDNCTNRIVLSGKIVNKYEAEKTDKQNRITSLTIAITESNGRNQISNYPSVIVFRDNETGRSIVDDFSRNDWVRVEGYLSSSAKSRLKKDTYRMQQIVIDKIEMLDPTYPEAIGNNKGNPHYETCNRTVLKGEVRSVLKRTNNVTNISIDAINNGVHNTILVTAYGNLARSAANEISIGDTIKIGGKISTSIKEADRRKVHYQNIVAKSITPVDKDMGEYLEAAG